MMQIPALAALLVLLSSTATALDGPRPYIEARAKLQGYQLLDKRQSCHSGYNLCSNLGSTSACCPTGTNCVFDPNGNAACCPYNALCTGTVGGTLTGSITGGATTSNAFVLGQTTTTTAFQTAQATEVSGGGSTIVNSYYPFIYIPSSYLVPSLCSSAWTYCQAQSTSCLVSLAGANGVTVSGLGGGVTQTGQSGTIVSAASSICSSLSAEACYNLQLSQCSSFSAGLTTSNGFEQNLGGARPTACPGMVYAMGAGAAFGAAGFLR